MYGMSEVSGMVRSLSASWVEKDAPALGSFKGVLTLNAFPHYRDDDQTFQLGEGEIERLLERVPSGIFTQAAVSLFVRSGGKMVNCMVAVEDHEGVFPLWLRWSLSHNAYVNSLVNWAVRESREIAKPGKKSWSPVQTLVPLRFRGFYFTDMVKDFYAATYQRPLSLFTMHHAVSSFFLARHVQDAWANDYMSMIEEMDDAFERLDGDYRKKKSVLTLAKDIQKIAGEYGPKLYDANRARPIPFHTELDGRIFLPTDFCGEVDET